MIKEALKFQPILQKKIWGGDKLKNKFNKKSIEVNIGESWEISGVNGNETIVSEGMYKGKTLKQLIQLFKEDFVGKKVYEKHGEQFPLLIKFIDAKTPLSIQVHPGDELAKKMHNSFGKNEMWYVMEAEENAELIVGFNQSLNKDTYLKNIESDNLRQILNVEKIKKGDTYNIPTGLVHAIGAGVMLAEIQQTSDITYRIYDYDRIDKNTNQKRELHTVLALEAIDFSYKEQYQISYVKKENSSVELVHTNYFKTNIINVLGVIDKDYALFDSFVIYMCVAGSLSVLCNNNTYSLKTGETLLLPASINKLKISSNHAELLEVYL